jgi:DNA-binding CsgD family transcriptional regulator
MDDDSARTSLPAPEATYAVDDSGRIVSWSDAAERVLGFTRDEALGRCCYELLRGRDAFGNRYCGRLCPIRTTAAAGHAPQPFAVVLQGLSAEHPLRIRIQCVPQPGSELASVVHIVDSEEQEAAELILRLREAARRAVPLAAPGPEPANPLTQREHEIVKLLAEGSPAKVVAARLGVSRATVRNHIQNVLRKLDVHGQVEAVSIAFRSGWL